MTTNNADIKTILEELGYDLTDNGNHWRSKAVYRDGDNPTSLLIYKDSGVWIDYVASPDKPMPFNKLVELSGGGSYSSPIVTEKHKKKIEFMSKVYPDSILDRLMPLHDFYKKKNISVATQKLYKCGYASAGNLFRRVVFPIYNKNKQITGFSGRAIYDNPIKWKHMGRKSEWVYPYYLHESFRDAVLSSGEVVLVESIGDSMALCENGFQNHLVTFGLSHLSALLPVLTEAAPKKIIIALNNDKFSKKDKPYAEIAMCKLYFKLLKFFDPDFIEIRRPVLGDFGEMQESSKSKTLFSEWSALTFNLDEAARSWGEINKKHGCFNKEIVKKIDRIIC